ncbi:hypothetical protein ACFOWA_09905 [Pedobacter lithocola]|uniref:Transmembrane protein n=1 Tax=Pedobacter lithocola TaxID=1908239 RepID=A0ABV8PBJ6_9SPHI
MASFSQRFFIVLILLIAFTSRVVIYAMPVTNVPKEIFKTEPDAKSEPVEKENSIVEKVKFADLLMPGFSTFEFKGNSNSKSYQSSANAELTYCHLQIPEQPPK